MDQKHFSLFGFGRDGIPSEVDELLCRPGAVQRMADHIIRDSLARGERHRRSAPEHLASQAFMLVAWLNKRREPIPPLVMTALAHVLGLVSYRTGVSTVSAQLRTELGLASEVALELLPGFLTAAQLDGMADAAGGSPLSRRTLAAYLDISERGVAEWRKVDLYKHRRAFCASLGALGAPPVPRLVREQLAWLRRQRVPDLLPS